MKQKQLRQIIGVLLPTTVLVSIMVWGQSRELENQVRSLELPEVRSLPYIAERSHQEPAKVPLIGEIPSGLFNNALVAGKVRPHKVKFTFGISCIQRQQNKTYIFSTIDSLLEHSTLQQQKDIAIVILLADFSAETRRNLSNSLVQRYGEHFRSGLIRTIQAPRDFYPNLHHLKRTYNHPMVRVRWRSKQNYDFAYLMLYSRNISSYYLQLEDDVSTVPNYVIHMQHFISLYKTFACLEFCDLGFIAKLFHSSDLEKLAKLLMLFFNEQPNDVTYLHFNELMLQFRRIVRKPTLFQHHGYYSSLSIKRKNITDMYFNGQGELYITLPVLRRAENGIRGPEADIFHERYKIKKKLAEQAESERIQKEQSHQPDEKS